MLTKLIEFVNAFLSYLLLFGFIAVLCVIAVFVGIKLCKNKDLKERNMVDSK